MYFWIEFEQWLVVFKLPDSSREYQDPIVGYCVHNCIDHFVMSSVQINLATNNTDKNGWFSVQIPVIECAKVKKYIAQLNLPNFADIMSASTKTRSN